MIDPALIPPGWGWALFALDPAGPVTVELYTDGGETIEFQGATEMETWGAVAAFLGAPIAEELFPLHDLSPDAAATEPVGPGAVASPDGVPVPAEVDPFS